MGTRPVTVIACVAARLVTQYLQSWTKVLEHLHFWAFSNSHRSNPSTHPTNNVGRVYPEFFPSFNFVHGGGRENCRKISKRMRCFMREPRVTENMDIALLSQGRLSMIVDRELDIVQYIGDLDGQRRRL